MTGFCKEATIEKKIQRLTGELKDTGSDGRCFCNQAYLFLESLVCPDDERKNLLAFA